ncbi:protein of unknown function [Cnuella takakiae]|uniref:3-keto-alpha-glucoside-1,2-lyase/3-keto-2-hydroxy-glucal hydratase domain-containing protein n=1 Tax=Cnuella takakiae TaxID=1302690 RepID=A0A1M5I552_9BACT|nr:DUF1080 domain-containing protein [Cnuella takakiae]OLY93178.1 hypothetical protein BUE76_15750 [Cnuella takakiae]SHG23454.1 protein of unknown function [Cnuella takakiae]
MNCKALPTLFLATLLAGGTNHAFAQKPEDTEQWKPVPKTVVTKSSGQAPADAIVLFDGDNLNQWLSVKDSTQPAQWTVNGDVFTVKKGTGNIRTKQAFGDYQLHLEFRIPKNITGKGQGRGNSGLFLASIGPGDDGYELQILDSYQNETYVNGQAGSIYKQTAPLANPTKAPGEWNLYDIAWKAPRFKADGSLETPAMVTVFLNGVLVQNHTILQGPTQYIGKASYRKAHGAAPIKLQDHGDPSEPISYRNIWIRPI